MAVEMLEDGTRKITRNNPIFTDRLMQYGPERESVLRMGGVGYDERISATEAFQRQGLLDLTYSKEPLTALVNGVHLPMNQYAVVETNGATGDQRLIGDPVNKGYTLIQNAELAAALDPFTNRYQLDAVASLKQGTLVMVSLKFGDTYAINGEEHNPYLRITNGFGGMHALRAAITHIRLFCTNTLHSAWRGAEARWSFKHKSNVQEDFTGVISLQDAMREASQRMRDELTTMAGVRIGPEDVQHIFDKAFKHPEKGDRLRAVESLARANKVQAVQLGDNWAAAAEEYERRVERFKILRGELDTRFQIFNDQFPRSANTPYAAYQTVAEMVDASVAESRANLAYSVLEGVGYKRTIAAYRAAAQFAGIDN